MNALAVLQLLLLAAFGFAVLAGALVSGIIPWVVARTHPWAPERRHTGLMLLALSPALLGGFGLLSALVPSFRALLWPASDHCHTHHGHVHLCLVHPPHHLGNLGSWVVLSIALAWLLARVTVALVDLVSMSWAAARLLNTSPRRATELDARVLPLKVPFCLLLGVVRPVIVVSEGLLARLTPVELDVVLEHERAHAAQHDTLRRMVARAATLFVWPTTRTRLLRALTLAAEQRCDERAARAVGDRLGVAETILKVERLLQAHPFSFKGVSASFSDEVPERVTALLEPPRTAGSIAAPITLLTGALLALLAASGPLHHLTESLLGALSR